MAKFRSVLHEKARDSRGGMGGAGISVLIPLDDAAKVHSISERAEGLIDPKTKEPYWVRTEPKEVTLKRMKNAELKAMGKKQIP